MTKLRGRALRLCGLTLASSSLVLVLASRSRADDGGFLASWDASQQFWEDSYGGTGCSGSCNEAPCCKVTIIPPF